MSRGTKVRPKSLIRTLKVLLEEVIVEEGVTKKALIGSKDEAEVTFNFLV